MDHGRRSCCNVVSREVRGKGPEVRGKWPECSEQTEGLASGLAFGLAFGSAVDSVGRDKPRLFGKPRGDA